MLKKLTLVAGFGAGYVLGAKAGTERYNQIQAKFNEFAGKPAVQNATSTVKDKANDVAGTAKSAVNDKVENLSDSSSSSKDKDVVVDLGTTPVVPPVGATTTSTTRPSAPGTGTPPKPMTGAVPSESTIGTTRL